MATEMLSVQAGRRFSGLFGDRERRRGLRFEGPIDQLAIAMREAGTPVTCEPLENGLPNESSVCVFRTWGSPWTDALEVHPGVILTTDMARSLSAKHQVIVYDYDLQKRRFRHEVFAAGQCVEEWHDDGAVDGQAERYLEARLRELKMRDWGVDLEDLSALRIPFVPALMMEAYFMKFDGGLSKVWGV
jgi:hypothetical protein